ncbi:MAG: helix-hairpin-helix domain-containing protein, partial [Desulfatiglandales bacterium]
YRLMGTGETQEVVASFIKQFYPDMLTLLPPLIITPVALKDSYEIGAWLKELSGRPIRIRSPKSASERMLVKMASQNALRLVSEEKEREEDLLLKLKEEARLKRYPRRIECVDISNFGGDYAVGSVVCYLDGSPYKKGYRSFLIRTVKGVDDYAMIREVISRRIKYPDLPDLLVIDGGKGHLNAAKRVLQDQIPLENPPEVIAIAKDRHESAQGDIGDGDRVFIFNRKDPIKLEKQVLHLLMSIRDEAHRKAISHHKKRMSKGLKVSFLDQIKGIGPKKKRMLLKEFGSLKEILEAEVEELTKIPGISPEIAEEILRKGKELLERDREA